jgi:glucosamine-6-phosphate deaminase
MNVNLFDKVDIDKKNTNLPCGIAEDKAAECARYNALVASFGGADVQVLGIGLNGHIGFNEPSDKFSKGTNVVDLTESTIEANSRFFASKADVPTQAFSMGIDQIMMAKKVILLANGKAKAEILEKSFFGDVTPKTPASILQFACDVEVYADEEALSVIIEKHPDALLK